VLAPPCRRLARDARSASRRGLARVFPVSPRDGLLVGYFHTDDLAAAWAAMEATDVNRRWQAEMAAFFVDLPGGRPDRGMLVLDEVFNLEDQLEGPP